MFLNKSMCVSPTSPAQPPSAPSALFIFPLRTHWPCLCNHLPPDMDSPRTTGWSQNHFQELQSKTAKVQAPISSASNSTEILLQWNFFHLAQNIKQYFYTQIFLVIRNGSTVYVSVNYALVKNSLLLSVLEIKKLLISQYIITYV